MFLSAPGWGVLRKSGGVGEGGVVGVAGGEGLNAGQETGVPGGGALDVGAVAGVAGMGAAGGPVFWVFD